jgi:uncharacterized protein
MFTRDVKLPKKQSFFLFGARQTGKSTFISQCVKEERHLTFNLLERDTQFTLMRDPTYFRRRVESAIKKQSCDVLFVDEIQKIPSLLDEVQILIDSYRLRCILTGSSARKLRRGGANLLGGRVRERRLFPLTVGELNDQFELDFALRYGSLPSAVLL